MKTEAEDHAASAAYQQYDPTCSAISERYTLLETLYFLNRKITNAFDAASHLYPLSPIGLTALKVEIKRREAEKSSRHEPHHCKF